MFKGLVLSLLLAVFMQAAYLEELKWKKGESFLSFLESNNIPLYIYYDLDAQDRELATEIMSDVKYQVLKNDDNQIEQVLIPVGEELQIHIIYDKISQKYSLHVTPVLYKEEFLSLAIDIERSPYQDIVKATNNNALAHEFMNSYKKSVNFKHIQKGDRLVIFYSQRKRLGKRFQDPKLLAAMVEVNKKPHYVFLYDENRYFNDKGHELEGYLLRLPLDSYKRISSPFTQKRWHPILKKYRAHLGIDYAAKVGTRVKAAGSGVVSYVGTKGGYGKTIEIRHKDGYKTLYAHLNGYKKGIKRGKKVKKGELIGYVGSTGMSTGPHLHFGLYKNNRAINPNKVVKITKNIIPKKEKKAFDKMVNEYKNGFKTALEKRANPPKEQNFDYVVLLNSKDEKQNAN